MTRPPSARTSAGGGVPLGRLFDWIRTHPVESEFALFLVLVALGLTFVVAMEVTG